MPVSLFSPSRFNTVPILVQVDSVWVKAGINGESDSPAISNALKDMKYLDAVVKETVR